MAFRMNHIVIFTSLLLSLLAISAPHHVSGFSYDVTKYGAKANGVNDISQALLKAWNESCSSAVASTVVIPAGTYALGEVVISGPCKAPVNLVIKGTLRAPSESSKIKSTGWVAFQRIDHFTMSGGGIFDGQGTTIWSKQCQIYKTKTCKQLPISLRFDFVTNSIVRDITSKDSKQFHINLMGCNNLTLERVTVSAHGDSANTDGIHIGRCKGIKIIDTNIKTGDDCISIGDGSEQIDIEKVTCGPGHGISIGSLGLYRREAPVVGVHVKTCTFTNTTNGVRVKTWPSGNKGSASNMHFEDLTMVDVGTPILIDQEYCPHDKCNLKTSSQVQLSDISFANIRGTTTDPQPVKLICSKSLPCKQVKLQDIDLKFTGKVIAGQTPAPLATLCRNVKPTLLGHLVPGTCTLL